MSRPPGLTSRRAATFSFLYFGVARSKSRLLGANFGGSALQTATFRELLLQDGGYAWRSCGRLITGASHLG